MCGALKCLVVFCVVPTIFGYMGVRDDPLWFKNGERLKNRFVTGVVNGIVDFHCNDTVNGANVEGECLSKVECTKAGGKVGGLCSLLGSCCMVERTCGETTSSKLSYFVPPKKFQTNCPLVVNVYSKDVCQIRLDFEKFDIAKPTNQTIKNNQNENEYTSYRCNDDSFKVENVGKKLGFPHLCGKNKGQHIYIPVTENTQRLVLRFSFKNRTANVSLPQPDWRIKIRQLECKRSYDHLNVPSKLLSMYNSLKNKKRPKPDWDLIAPPNCLQYYPEKSGTFESFNYDEGRGCYIGHLDYAICFRKTPEICGAKYTAAGTFQMNYNAFDPSERKESEKCHPKQQANSKISQDYIRIPGGKNSENFFRDTYCNSDLSNNNIVHAKSFEPLYVGVHTDGYRANAERSKEGQLDDFEEIGFRIRYELESGDCDVIF